MDKYAILLGYFDKQFIFIEKIYREMMTVDVSIYDKRFLFAMRVQQFYTALEDLFKQTAKSFENHIEQMSNFHKELLARMNTEVPKIRPAVISHQSFLLLDKIRAFRHFVRHAYDCELDANELLLIQNKLKKDHPILSGDLKKFQLFVQNLSES